MREKEKLNTEGTERHRGHREVRVDCDFLSAISVVKAAARPPHSKKCVPAVYSIQSQF